MTTEEQNFKVREEELQELGLKKEEHDLGIEREAETNLGGAQEEVMSKHTG